MKKFLVILVIFFVGYSVNAEIVQFETNVNMDNFWDKNGKEVQKVMQVGTKIINANKLDKRVPFVVNNNKKIINAYASLRIKYVNIYAGLLPYIDNDDELAYILGHETVHTLDAYSSPGKWLVMIFNVRSYEYRADLIGVDLMVKAGYNPIAAITEINKWMPEPTFDFPWTHPKPSRRALEIYKYIYKKYPWALKTDMVNNVNYQNFVYSAQKEIDQFIQDEKLRGTQRKNKYDL